MFCLDPLHPIYNAILEAVAAQPGITMAQLHDTVRKKHKVDTSLQHLYRTVSRLIDDQILLKAQVKLSINAMWLSYLEFFADTRLVEHLESHAPHLVAFKTWRMRALSSTTSSSSPSCARRRRGSAGAAAARSLTHSL